MKTHNNIISASKTIWRQSGNQLVQNKKSKNKPESAKKSKENILEIVFKNYNKVVKYMKYGTNLLKCELCKIGYR